MKILADPDNQYQSSCFRSYLILTDVDMILMKIHYYIINFYRPRKSEKHPGSRHPLHKKERHTFLLQMSFVDVENCCKDVE